MTAGQALLVATLAFPALGAAGAAILPARADRAGRLVAVSGAALALVASVLLYGWRPAAPAGPARPGEIRPWHELNLRWASGLDLRFHIGVDGISYPLVVLTALLTLICGIYTLWTVPAVEVVSQEAQPRSTPPPCTRGRLLAALLLAIEVGIVGVFLSLDLVLFFVFFEVVLLPMYAVIAVWGGPARRHAARKFVLYTLSGSVLLLVGVFLVVTRAGTGDLVALSAAHGAGLSEGLQLAAFVLLALAFAVKSPLWPLHSWLPDAHTEAPTVGSVILAGVLLKMGTYGLLRIAVGVLPDAARRVAPVLGVLAVAAILVGGLVCLAQTELKRLIAYSSVGHMGFVLLGIATLNATGVQAALIGNIAHGIVTGLLFFLAGAIKDRAHTGELAQLGGLRDRMPRLAGLLGYAAIASLGLPGLAGFWGEAFAVIAALRHGGPLWTVLAVAAALGGALAAAYFLRLLRRVSHGPVGPAFAGGCPPLSAGELVSWAPLVLLTLAVGLIPALVLGLAHDPVMALVAR
ncbi:NADH-quinone oxidoreductase subunit M [Rugosimonospora acidiphila]|uniref:NADH-quinone oxidoreductase subunit M n=1 Tax=Rugosimonospora acidiphila TaxID=556531 RepID=A0ABP9RHR8_9ACTN